MDAAQRQRLQEFIQLDEADLPDFIANLTDEQATALLEQAEGTADAFEVLAQRWQRFKLLRALPEDERKLYRAFLDVSNSQELAALVAQNAPEELDDIEEIGRASCRERVFPVV